MRQSPDDRAPEEDTTPKAKKGKPKPDSNALAAQTWVKEANNNVLRAIDYFERAAELWAKVGAHDTAQYFSDRAKILKEL